MGIILDIILKVFTFLLNKLISNIKFLAKNKAIKETITEFSKNRNILKNAFKEWKKSEIFQKYLNEQWEHISSNLEFTVEVIFESFYKEYRQSYICKNGLTEISKYEDINLKQECKKRLSFFVNRLVYLAAASKGQIEATKLLDRKLDKHVEGINERLEKIEKAIVPPSVFNTGNRIIGEKSKGNLQNTGDIVSHLLQEKTEEIARLIETGKLTEAEKFIEELLSEGHE